MRNIPEIKPPICANQAVPPFEITPSSESPPFIWTKNQIPSTILAGIIKVVKKINNITKTCTLAFGKLIKYAPKIPAIAPLAPIIGSSELGFVAYWPNAANSPEDK